MTNADQVTAMHFALANAAQFLETRAGLDPAMARFAAQRVLEILYPYGMVAVHAVMADTLRDAGAVDVADTIDEVGHRYLTELTQQERS